MTETECDDAPAYLRRYCRGESGLPAAKELAYLKAAHERGEIGEPAVKSAEARAAAEGAQSPEEAQAGRERRMREAESRARQDGSLCVHRGGWLTDHRCPTCCGGSVAVPVYQCRLKGEDGTAPHRQCCDRPGVEGVKDCGDCAAFVARTASVEAAGRHP